MFNQTAVDKAGGPVNIQNHEIVGLYFSAHWCPPCKGFTPQLAQAYSQWKANGESIEIIFISSDQDEASYMNYYNTMMPWARMPFNQQHSQQFGGMFNVSGIPCLVILDRGTNKILSTEGWADVRNNGANAIQSWKQNAGPQKCYQPLPPQPQSGIKIDAQFNNVNDPKFPYYLESKINFIEGILESEKKSPAGENGDFNNITFGDWNGLNNIISQY